MHTHFHWDKFTKRFQLISQCNSNLSDNFSSFGSRNINPSAPCLSSLHDTCIIIVNIALRDFSNNFTCGWWNWLDYLNVKEQTCQQRGPQKCRTFQSLPFHWRTICHYKHPDCVIVGQDLWERRNEDDLLRNFGSTLFLQFWNEWIYQTTWSFWPI